VYQTEVDGVHHELGTSGFLYRSSKLMYDHATKSFWSTLQGKPVVGPLVGKDIKLNQRYLVTTTWGDWKKRHPDTTVLSLNTGHRRDYGEGVAYRDYFSTDKLMFTVSALDKRLLNKDEVLVFRNDEEQLAIAIKFLAKQRIYHDTIGDQNIVVLADAYGTSRAYDANEVSFESWNGNDQAIDSNGLRWKVLEEALTSGDRKLRRMPSHNVFWFGWVSQFPETRLVK
jgi:hypothetical protein